MRNYSTLQPLHPRWIFWVDVAQNATRVIETVKQLEGLRIWYLTAGRLRR
jgi:hypothetical protein